MNNPLHTLCMTPDWDTYFMSLVVLVAMKSKDPSSHIGAVITTMDNQLVSTGYNGFPRGVEYTDLTRQERPEKYFFYEHAERNAIYHAARHGVSTMGCKMYTSGCPCADCGRGIIQAGIIEVIGDKAFDTQDNELWTEHAKRTIKMFREAGVTYRQWIGELIIPTRLYKGKKI